MKLDPVEKTLAMERRFRVPWLRWGGFRHHCPRLLDGSMSTRQFVPTTTDWIPDSTL
jgi:hypothetical protein